jgi:CubicO group peptidase (beta-lactamase class C family)
MKMNHTIDRRKFLALACSASWAGTVLQRGPDPGLDEFFRRRMETDHIPGVVACILKRGALAWSATYGYANLAKRAPMTLDTLQNIGSISKTVATTALMQFWEKGRFKLDDDIGRYLSFPVRNPAHPAGAITFRHLLTHTSSIADGSAYAQKYACGDPTLALGEWLRQYLAPGGTLYRPSENYHSWAPGTKWDYCNIAYGVVAHLVELLAKTPFSDYCKQWIFEPLQMTETSWYLSGIDTARHAVPYSWVSSGKVRGPNWGGIPQGVVGPERTATPADVKDGYEANCLYNHPNYPDGFLRTSVAQLARYSQMYLNLGGFEKKRLLKEETVREMLTPQRTEKTRVQGLTWYGFGAGERLAWGHSGGDPGINTDVRFRLSDGVAAIVFTNTWGIKPDELTARLLREAESL